MIENAPCPCVSHTFLLKSHAVNFISELLRAAEGGPADPSRFALDSATARAAQSCKSTRRHGGRARGQGLRQRGEP
jgi:hypothetical protein